MRFRQSALIFAFLIFGFTACSGGGVTAPPTAGSTASFGTMATVDTAQSIAEGHASSFAQARDNDDGITVKPKRLQFDSVSASPQTVTVSVKEKTTVYAASRDSHVAAVSPGVGGAGVLSVIRCLPILSTPFAARRPLRGGLSTSYQKERLSSK